MSETTKSALAKSIEAHAQNRKLRFFDASEFTSPTSAITGKIAIRVAMKSEELQAIAQAEAFTKKITNGEKIAFDALSIDIRTVHILWVTVRDGESDERAKMFPAFESPRWMMDNLTNDEIAALLNLSNSVMRAESPVVASFAPEVVEQYIDALCALTEPQAFGFILARCDREWLEQFAVECSLRIKEARGALDALEAKSNVVAVEPEPSDG